MWADSDFILQGHNKSKVKKVSTLQEKDGLYFVESIMARMVTYLTASINTNLFITVCSVKGQFILEVKKRFDSYCKNGDESISKKDSICTFV